MHVGVVVAQIGTLTIFDQWLVLHSQHDVSSADIFTNVCGCANKYLLHPIYFTDKRLRTQLSSVVGGIS